MDVSASDNWGALLQVVHMGSLHCETEAASLLAVDLGSYTDHHPTFQKVSHLLIENVERRMETQAGVD